MYASVLSKVLIGICGNPCESRRLWADFVVIKESFILVRLPRWTLKLGSVGAADQT
jgi:hypothetical protein